MKRWALTTLLASACVMLGWPAAGQAQYTGDLKGGAYEYHDLFPIFGKKLAQRGVRFPLPWGVGLNYMYIQQPIDISSISLGVNNSGMQDMSNFIKFRSVDSTVHALNARVDLWLFPFLNVYVLGNFSPKTVTKVELSDPFPLKSGVEQTGGGTGFGATTAFGVRGFWTTVDLNFSWTSLQQLSAPVFGTLVTPRVGFNMGTLASIGVNLWVGTMGQFIGAATSGSIKLNDAIGAPSDEIKDKVNNWYEGLPPGQQQVVQRVVEELQGSGAGDAVVHYHLDKKVANTWNMLIGTQLELNERWFVRAEVGFIKRTSALVGLNYRFNTPGF